ncbi:MAG TPA: M14-type cytosolic carboxypeptidase [Saprospiraceae bacterium]|nr:M14-type cytosolic carboxypeptidase [Saprospiraceae bacterium]
MDISSNFDSGNIEVVSIDAKKNDIRLRIRKDTNSDFLQWFHFRLNGAVKKTCRLSIINAGKTSYPDGWKNYRVCVSYDRKEWFRIPTSYSGGVLKFIFTPAHNDVYFAYFAPYSYERHLDLVHKAQMTPEVKVEIVGKTFNGRNIEMLVIGKPRRNKKIIWVIARQHPGEPMAEWFIEGFLDRLLDPNDTVSKILLEDAIFYVVPNMNIDGSIAGNLRSNASGANLNREWQKPTRKLSPEVYYVRKKILETGINLMLDVHGDEELPYNFIAASEGIPTYSDYLAVMEKKFIGHWMDVSPEFQNTYKYPIDKFGEANMTLCSNYIAQHFGCLALTIEMPFKDNADLPDRKFGWSDVRSRLLGASVLNPVLKVLYQLR